MKKLLFSISLAALAALSPLLASSASAFSLFGHHITITGSSDQQSASYTSMTPRQTTADDSKHPCVHYTNHVYEVCYAYAVNSSLLALVPYYKYASSPNPATSKLAAEHLNKRYYGDAYTTIQNRVASWPAGTKDVATPQIRIISVNSSLASSTATLVTQESWLVTDKNDRVIYRETNQRHVITMQRVKSYILHKWVVTDIR